MAAEESSYQSVLWATVRTARISERLRGSLVATMHVVEALGAVGELTDDTTSLAPEILAAIEKATELSEIIERASNTAMVQSELAIEKILEEGDDSAEG